MDSAAAKEANSEHASSESEEVPGPFEDGKGKGRETPVNDPKTPLPRAPYTQIPKGSSVSVENSAPSDPFGGPLSAVKGIFEGKAPSKRRSMN
jgi:hypothetical protein